MNAALNQAPELRSKRSGWCFASIAILLVAGASVFRFVHNQRGERETPPVTASTLTEDDQATASGRIVETTIQARARGEVGSPSLDGDPAKVARVRAALNQFERVLGGITRDQLEAEQKVMRQANERMMAVKTETPTSETFTDENGMKWVKLVYPSGEVRYDLSD